MSSRVIAVSGIKNSGKTTIISRLLPCLDSLGLRVAVIKHDGHSFEADREGTDTFKFLAAGAYGAAIFDGEKFQAVKRERVTWQQLAELYPEADLIILEGFKDSDCPKIEILRSGLSSSPCCDEKTVIALVTDTGYRISGVPTYSPDDIQGIAKFIFDYNRRQ